MNFNILPLFISKSLPFKLVRRVFLLLRGFRGVFIEKGIRGVFFMTGERVKNNNLKSYSLTPKRNYPNLLFSRVGNCFNYQKNIKLICTFALMVSLVLLVSVANFSINKITVLASLDKNSTENQKNLEEQVQTEFFQTKPFSIKNIELNLNTNLKRNVKTRKQHRNLIIKETNHIREFKRKDLDVAEKVEFDRNRLSTISFTKEKQLQNNIEIDCSSQKCIAITFDDGPIPANTNRLLDYLKERNVPATFYMVGSLVQSYPEVVKRAYQEGHEIGNHTWNHPDLTKIPLEKVFLEIDSTNNIIENTIGQKPATLRPPFGSINQQLLDKIDIPVVNWSIDTLDWRDRDPDLIAKRAIAGARRDGIILLHDLHSTTVDAVPYILDTLISQDYKFVTVSEILGYKDNPEDIPKGKLFTDGRI